MQGLEMCLILTPNLSEMKKLFIFAIIIVFASCKSTRPPIEKSGPDFLIENLVGLNSEEIKQKYPTAVVKEEVGMFEEGTVERPYTIIFPDTPDEIHITWKDNARTTINDIRFTERGKWRSAGGIEIGTTYEELNQINGKKIDFYGFGWDYSGAVVWNEGKLEDSNLRVFLAPEEEPKTPYIGDHVIKASPGEIADMNLKVRTIIYKTE